MSAGSRLLIATEGFRGFVGAGVSILIGEKAVVDEIDERAVADGPGELAVTDEQDERIVIDE